MSTNYIALTDRDLQILRMVYEYEGVAIEHVKAKFFGGPGRTPCYRRISLLINQGYLLSTRVPGRGGAGRSFLSLGPKARPVLGKLLGLGRSELRRTRIDSPMFIYYHQLCLCDFRVALELAIQESSPFSLEEWTSERELRQLPLKLKDPQSGKEIPLIPDSAFTLSLPDRSVAKFDLEMDLGTVAAKRMRVRLRGYLLRPNESSTVLFVVPDLARREAIVSWVLEEAEDLNANPTGIWVTIKDWVTKDSVLSSEIWKVVGGPEALSIEALAGNYAPHSVVPPVALVRGIDGGLVS